MDCDLAECPKWRTGQWSGVSDLSILIHATWTWYMACFEIFNKLCECILSCIFLSTHPPFLFNLINWPIVLRDLKLDIEVDGDISVDTCVVRFILWDFCITNLSLYFHLEFNEGSMGNQMWRLTRNHSWLGFQCTKRTQTNSFPLSKRNIRLLNRGALDLQCSVTCGDGNKKRFVSCSGGRNKCDSSSKPEAVSRCNLGACPEWLAAEWSQVGRLSF